MRFLCWKFCAGLVLSVFVLSASHFVLGADDWPQWRGPHRDGHSPAKGLLKAWPSEGLQIAWQADVGIGYASVAVKDGRLFTQGDLDGIEQIICLDASSGSRLWARQAEPAAKELQQRVAKEFQQIDKNGDEKIDELEALARFGWDWNKFNRPAMGDHKQQASLRAEALFTQLDKDGDGKLTFAEAGGLLRDAFDRADVADKTADAKSLAEQRATKFMKLDKEGEGKVSKAEAKETDLERRFDQLDEKDSATQKGDELLTKDEISKGLAKHEAGRDGVVSKEELAALYMQTKGGDDELRREELKAALGGYRDGAGDGPRGTPAVDGERVYALGAFGDLTCLDAENGNTIWHIHLTRDFKGQRPGSGYCESPLVVENLVIVSPGGSQGTVLALDKATGKKVWQSSEVKESPDYVSAISGTIAGKKQVVQFARESVFGLDLASGKLLWRYAAPASPNANCCTPIIDGDHVFASSSYGTGGGLAQIENRGNVQEATEVYFQKKMTCHYGGMVKVGDCVYSNADGPLVCMDFATGKIRWQARTVGKGSIIAADGMLYLVSEGHELALVEASPDKYRPHGRFKSPAAKAAVLAHPAIASGKLFVRAQELLTAYDLRDASQPRIASPPKNRKAK